MNRKLIYFDLLNNTVAWNDPGRGRPGFWKLGAYFFIRSVRSLASEMPSTCAVRFCDFLSWSLIVMYSTDWAMWMPTRLVCAGCAIFSHFSFCSISLTLLLPPSLLTHTYTFPRTHLSQMLIYVHILSLSFSIIKDLVAVE